MANFVNDVAHENKLQNSVIEQEFAGFDFGGKAPDGAAARTRRGDHGVRLPARDGGGQRLSAIRRRPAGLSWQPSRCAACQFQDDPHNQKITISTFEEYGHNSTHLRDRLLLATARLLAGWVKMPGERDCFARFEKEWIYN